jgi:hypothetical protein
MSTDLPVPIVFELPDGWRTAPPDAAGAPDAAFVALGPQPDQGFTANITIDGAYRPDDAALADIAHESAEHLRLAATAVEVVDRQEIGSAEAPGLTQTLSLSTTAGGVARDLLQTQVYLSLLDVADPARRAVIRLVLTATAAQHPDVIEEFKEFLSTVRLDVEASS